MDEFLKEYPFKLVLSLKPLIDCVRKSLSDPGGANSLQAEGLEKLLSGAPELYGPIQDMNILKRHSLLVEKLMSFVFPPVFWEREAVTAAVPFTGRPIFISPHFKRLFSEKDGNLMGRLNLDEATFRRGRALKAYLLILSGLYDIHETFEYPLIRMVEDPDTHLDRHFRILPDFRFVEAHPIGEFKAMNEAERMFVLAHITEPDRIKEVLPPGQFELQGLALLHAVDVTQSEMISSLSRDLVDRQSLISQQGFERLQDRLRALFRDPSLVVGLTAIQEDKFLLLNACCKMGEGCIFSSSMHVPVTELTGTVFHKAIQEDRIITMPDANKDLPERQLAHIALDPGVRSLLFAPLYFKGECIGTLHLGSHEPGGLGPMDALVVEQVRPLFAMAMKRALDDLENRIQRIIKQECTAIHGSVEWRFRRAALNHLAQLRMGHAQKLEPIVFKDVHALYGISDIRGSTDERNKAIQRDLIEHLDLSLQVISSALDAKPLPILRELAGRVRRRMEKVEKALGTADEISIAAFLKEEVESIFPYLRGFGSGVVEALGRYESAVDGSLCMVNRARRGFEESVQILNDRLVSYLDLEESQAQSICPHFFERHRTDGVDYLLYIGRSLMENGEFNKIYLKNLRLWQLQVACGMAWLTHQIRPTLKVPLDTAHLVLVQNSSLSIGFRFDEKRFDAEGMYDLRYEIIRSRIEKATVKDTGERITEPGKIAIVYSHPDEAREMRMHIEFLQSEGYLAEGTENLELGDMPGLQGVRALRVAVNLENRAFSERLGGILSAGETHSLV